MSKSLIIGFEYQSFKSGNVHELLHIVLEDGTGIIEHSGNRADMPVLKPRVFAPGTWVPSQALKEDPGLIGYLINPIRDKSNIKMRVK